MKPTPPTLRERNRYIAFELISEKKLARDAVVKSLWNVVLRFLGEWDAGDTGFTVIEWDAEKDRGIARTAHKSLPKVKAALALTTKVGDEKVRPRILGISGTLKKIRENWLKKTK